MTELDGYVQSGYKRCSNDRGCNTIKPLFAFSTNNRNKDKKCEKCKDCQKIYRINNKEKIKERDKRYHNANKETIRARVKIYEQNNKDNISIQKKQYRIKNIDKIKKRDSKYYETNKLKISEQSKKHYAENRQTYLEQQKTYRIKNIDKVRQRNKRYYYSNKEEILKKQRERAQIKSKTDPVFKLKECLRRDLRRFKYDEKSARVFDYLGCSLGELKIHIESQFKDGMTWDNWSNTGWHIDHIIPLATIKNIDDIEQINKVCHYTNLRPMWAKDNLRKSDFIEVNGYMVKASHIGVGENNNGRQ